MIAHVVDGPDWVTLGNDAVELRDTFHPSIAKGIVVEDEGVVVGRWLMASMLHAEGLFIAPDRRRSPAIVRLLRQTMRAEAEKCDVPTIWTASNNARVTRLLSHPNLGATPVSVLPFLMPVRSL